MNTRPLTFREKIALEKTLAAGERVQWYVRPEPLPAWRELRIVLSVAAACCTFAGVFCLLLLGGQEIEPLAYFVASFVLLIAAGVILGVSGSLVNGCRSVYMVTDRRAIVLSPRFPFPGFGAQSYPLAVNMVVELVERGDGGGDIVLAYENTTPDVLGKRPAMGFLRLACVGAVAAALDSVAAVFPPRTDAEHARYMNWADLHHCLRKPEKSMLAVAFAMVLMGCAAFYGSTFLLEKPLHYLLHAERAIGRVVAVERSGDDAFIPIYEFRTERGKSLCQKVENSEYFNELQPGLETTVLYFEDAPEQAMAVCPRNMFGHGAFLAFWGIMFMTGGCLGLRTYRQQVRAWRRLHR